MRNRPVGDSITYVRYCSPLKHAWITLNILNAGLVIYCIFLELSCHQMQKHVLYLVQMCVPWHLCNCSSHEHYRIMYTSISDEMVTLNLGFRYVLRYYHAELDYLKEKIFFTFFVKFLQHMFWFLRMGGTPKSLWKFKNS